MALRITRTERKALDEARALAEDAVDDITALGNVLREVLDRLTEERDARSDRWHESERGEAANDWLSALEEVVEEVERLAEELPDAVENVVGIEDEPEA